MENTIDFKKLAEPFEKSEVKRFIGKGKRQMEYITARHVMNRLDQVAGPANWRDEYQITPVGVICTLFIRVAGEWIGKSDIGTESDIEPEKGGFSGALKRAAVKWGIGRELYQDGTAYDDDEPSQKPAPQTRRIPQPAPAVKPAVTPAGQEAVNSPADPDLVSEHPLPLPAHHTTQTGKNGDGEKKYKLALWKRSLAVFGMADGLMRKTIGELPDGINWGMIIYTRAKETLGYRDEEHVKDTLGVASLKEWETTLGELMCILVENAPTPDGVPEPAQA